MKYQFFLKLYVTLLEKISVYLLISVSLVWKANFEMPHTAAAVLIGAKERESERGEARGVD